MILLKSQIKNSGLGLLPDGNHIVRIDSAIESVATERLVPWDDRTPQLSIKYKNSRGYITHWINLVGYFTKEDCPANVKGVIFKQHPYSKIWYAVDFFTNRRIENEAKTQTCLHILERIGNCAGIPQDSNFKPSDLIGLELGIGVVNSKVVKTYRKAI